MADQDLINLYSKRILALAADMPHADRLEAPEGTASKRSPLCGSVVTVDIRQDDGRVADLGMDVKACALGQASAAVLARSAVGLDRLTLQEGRDALHRMLKAGEAAPESGPFAALEALTPAKDFKNRHASIMLAWDATLEALDAASASRRAEGA
ncbi:MAG: iron-sulfur cluster assembly scaffold protein [Pseudomonadota bacterium]